MSIRKSFTLWDAIKLNNQGHFQYLKLESIPSLIGESCFLFACNMKRKFWTNDSIENSSNKTILDKSCQKKALTSTKTSNKKWIAASLEKWDKLQWLQNLYCSRFRIYTIDHQVYNLTIRILLKNVNWLPFIQRKNLHLLCHL